MEEPRTNTRNGREPNKYKMRRLKSSHFGGIDENIQSDSSKPTILENGSCAKKTQLRQNNTGCPSPACQAGSNHLTSKAVAQTFIPVITRKTTIKSQTGAEIQMQRGETHRTNP